jgi:hypothetical protein
VVETADFPHLASMLGWVYGKTPESQWVYYVEPLIEVISDQMI